LHVLRRRLHRGFSVELATTIARVARNNDVMILANALFLPALALSRSRLPVIWDTNECQTLHYRRLPPTPSNRLRGLVWQVLERWGMRRCALAVAIGNEEAAWWRTFYPGLNGRLVVVDHRALASSPPTGDLRHRVEKICHRPIPGLLLVFVGTLAAKHNVVATRWLLEVLAPGLPGDATLILCGPGTERLTPPPATRDRVVCLGSIDDLDSVIAAADFCLAPMAAGAGVKTKVLHYLSLGSRVIGTPVAFEGLAGAPGLLSAPLPELAQAVERALRGHESPSDARQRREDQLAWIEQTHSHQRVVAQWRGALECLNLI
jgi:hypothetical protein